MEGITSKWHNQGLYSASHFIAQIYFFIFIFVCVFIFYFYVAFCCTIFLYLCYRCIATAKGDIRNQCIQEPNVATGFIVFIIRYYAYYWWVKSTYFYGLHKKWFFCWWNVQEGGKWWKVFIEWGFFRSQFTIIYHTTTPFLIKWENGTW